MTDTQKIRRALASGKIVECKGRYPETMWFRVIAAKSEHGKTWVQEFGGLGGWFVATATRIVKAE